MKNCMKMSAFVLMASLMTSMTNPAFAKKYDGMTINIITTGGYTIKQPIIDHGKKFTELTGLKINMTGVPFSDIYSKMLTDFGAGTNSYDVGVFPPAWRARGTARERSDGVAGSAVIRPCTSTSCAIR